ncbi:MAG: prepilin-type N-terminal cleavage/methylation domain-containing protein [Acidobacteria bacterium]|nr:prepilin-type N-terminal cleavage/methylation domain-containing protein [Acidobacteriota bacterium]
MNRRAAKIRHDGGVAGRASGFTLLELLVSITMVSLLVTTVLFGWRIAASAWGKASSRLEEERTVLSTHMLLQEQMASMTPQQAWVEGSGREVFFQGEPQAARFVSRYSLVHRAQSGLYLIEYQIAMQPDGTEQLLLNESPVNSNEGLGNQIAGADMVPEGRKLRFAAFEPGAKTVRLLQGMQEIRFEYFRAASFSQPGEWTDQWLNFNNELPRAMAIRVVSRAESGALKPVSIVAAVRDFVRPTQ